MFTLSNPNSDEAAKQCLIFIKKNKKQFTKLHTATGLVIHCKTLQSVPVVKPRAGMEFPRYLPLSISLLHKTPLPTLLPLLFMRLVVVGNYSQQPNGQYSN